MKAPAPADLQLWSQEVASDPASLSFLPLARAFRKQGRRDAALKLCLRGLEHHPTHVEAHALLAMLYFESGQRSKAYDEWSMVLTLEPDNFEALRGMGFYHLEQGDDVTALRSLQRAGQLKPSDLAVQEALRMIHERRSDFASVHPVEDKDPWEEAWVPESAPAPAPAPAPTPTPTPTPEPVSGPVSVSGSEPVSGAVSGAGAGAGAGAAQPITAGDLPADPTQLFASLQKGGQILGALILDEQGLVLAGSLTGESGSKAEMLGAILGGAIEEAARTTSHLQLGQWKGILLEAEDALLHLAPVREGMIVLLAAKRQTPAGFMLRAAHQAASLATRFLELYA